MINCGDKKLCPCLKLSHRQRMNVKAFKRVEKEVKIENVLKQLRVLKTLSKKQEQELLRQELNNPNVDSAQNLGKSYNHLSYKVEGSDTSSSDDEFSPDKGAPSSPATNQPSNNNPNPMPLDERQQPEVSSSSRALTGDKSQAAELMSQTKSNSVKKDCEHEDGGFEDETNIKPRNVGNNKVKPAIPRVDSQDLAEFEDI